NSLICPVCLGLPGALPVTNKKAVEKGLKFATAVGAEIAGVLEFDRKNYFYPDLPKGYQITQYHNPLARGGKIRIETDKEHKYIELEECHLEEDAGKSFHGHECTTVDLNRCGVPLLEIVTRPVIHSPEEAYLFLKRLKQIVQYLGLSYADMEKGELRCDANISIRDSDDSALGPKVELKNLNSFRFIRRALEYEYKRQVKTVKAGNSVLRETRLYDEQMNTTLPMRSKEESSDYRFFPEPNLPPHKISKELIARLKCSLLELPDKRLDRYLTDMGLPFDSAQALISDFELSEYFEKTAGYCQDSKLAANWILTELMGLMSAEKISLKKLKISPWMLADLLIQVQKKQISGKIAATVLRRMIATGEPAEAIIEREGLRLITDRDSLLEVIEEVISENPENLKKYLDGREKLFVFFVGQVMAKTGGQADPQAVNKLLRETLDDRQA
ncbi:MAG: Asp-tRNA(Asn)/Glu-tRNA(Gln) amidotransferase subunit GatB, partial [candidate division Zixibacteria bacterium]|nr:Asp-tRNA(Asn)/Glu-tRNA(Gln) amidotransferase subunit GatB [candidate division Zixibacteria bacterium]